MPGPVLAMPLLLPPLAFGPALPSSPWTPPPALTAPLGVAPNLKLPPPGAWASMGLDSTAFQARQPRALIHPLVDGALLLGLMAATHGSWDARTPSQRQWETLGGFTPR